MSISVGRKQQVEGLHGVSAGRDRFVAFLADDASEKIVQQCVTEMSLPYSSVVRGDITKAINQLSAGRSPLALMVDISGVELPVSQIHHLAEVCEPGVTVVVIGDRNDVGLYRDLINAGISDYIVKPLTQTLAQSAIDNLLGVNKPVARSPLSQKQGQVVTVMGARGGVGTSTVATNLAWHLANKENRRVALVDLDLYYGSCALMLDIRASGGLREALENPQRVDELFLDRSMLRCGDKLHVLASEEGLDVKLTTDPAALTPLMTLLRKQFHYVIVDAPRWQRELMYTAAIQSNTAIIVLDQTAHAIRDAIRLRQYTETSELAHRTVLVLNRVGEQGAGGIDQKNLSETLGSGIQVMIPFHPKSAIEAANAGAPVSSLRSPIATAIATLADELGGRRLKATRPWWKFTR
jgi:pilus assembly protein CpaE